MSGYYWMKLNERFFTMPEIRALLERERGYRAVVVYLKIALQALNYQGMFYPYKHYPNALEELGAEIDEDPEELGRALKMLETVELVREQCGAWLVDRFEEYVGREHRGKRYYTSEELAAMGSLDEDELTEYWRGRLEDSETQGDELQESEILGSEILRSKILESEI